MREKYPIAVLQASDALASLQRGGNIMG